VTLQELADRLACRLDGDGALEVTRVAGIEDAGPGDLTFFSNPRYTAALRATRATAVILGDDAPAAPCAMLRTGAPYLAFARALSLFAPAQRPRPGVHPGAWLAPGVVCAQDATIGPFVSVGEGTVIGARTIVHANVAIGAGVVIGDDCLIHSNVAIRERVAIGHRVVVQNGAVIGSDGFGFAQRADGTHEKIPQIGRVVIEDDVEIGAGTTVDRPPVGETRIEAGTKIDNLVQIAHGVRVGRDVLLAAQVGIAGSTTLEDRVMLGGQVGVSGHITLGRGVRATAQTGIPNSLPAGAFVSGYPAIDNREWLKASIVFRRLPDLRRAVIELEQRVRELEARLAEAAAPPAGTGVTGSRVP
jgi:UDP-3-O-[3-hydroxymyristoyl] glucosamine N-acyltransferase